MWTGARSRLRSLALLAVCATPAAAQTLELRLREEANPTPISGAIVRLVGPDGSIAQGLTNEQGRLVLRAPAAGSYRLRIDRIGWTGFTTDAFSLVANETLRIAVPMISQRLNLPTIEVEGSTRCEGSSRGGELATALWDEIRKALTANLITYQTRMIPLHLREFVREVSKGEEPQREWVVLSTLVRGPPFGSLSPSALARIGFMREAGDTAHFAAPDAALLLSDEFVATHCFQAARRRGTLAGLAFQPVRGRGVTDVSGTLWVESASSELRFIEYSYTGLRGVLQRAELGGRVEFRKLSEGAWIVSYWHIRMPVLAADTVYPAGIPVVVGRLAGYVDRGGRAEVATDTLRQIDRALVRGLVYDSVAGRGLAGAVIGVEGTADSVLTDAQGRFELATGAAGDQIVTARHVRLGLLGEPTGRTALFSLGDSTRVEFAVPPMARFRRVLCGGNAGVAGIVGIVLSATGSPAAGQLVRVREPLRNRRLGEAASRSNARGLYALCDLPAASAITVELQGGPGGKLILLEQRLEVARGEYRWLDLQIPPEGRQ